MSTYILKDGQQQGPYTAEELDQLLQSESITGGDIYWQEGMAEWAPLFRFPGFTPAPRATPPPPPPPPMLPPLRGIPDPVPPAPTDYEGEIPYTKSGWIGILLLLIPVVGAVMLLLHKSPLMVGVFVVGATAVLAFVEARHLGMGSAIDLKPNGKSRTRPMDWFALLVALWFIGYPAFLFARRRYGVRNLILPGIATMGLYLGAIYLISQDALPAVDDPAVISLVQKVILNSPAGKRFGNVPGDISITFPGEVRFDRSIPKRYARAVLHNQLGDTPIYYTVEWQDRMKGIIWVAIVNAQTATGDSSSVEPQTSLPMPPEQPLTPSQSYEPTAIISVDQAKEFAYGTWTFTGTNQPLDGKTYWAKLVLNEDGSALCYIAASTADGWGKPTPFQWKAVAGKETDTGETYYAVALSPVGDPSHASDDGSSNATVASFLGLLTSDALVIDTSGMLILELPDHTFAFARGDKIPFSQ